ncbi:MAG: acetyl-CoA C-acyltransferase, partial [Candidatus Methanomethylicia archaeon]
FETAGIGVDRQCASAMTAINIGFMEIALGISDTIIAGGYEHMSRLPIGVGVDIDPKLFEAEKRFDWWIALNMGLTAEKLAEESGITAREMAEWSCRSHMLAWKAYSEGYFKDEIIPIEITLPDGSKQVIDRDLSIRSDTSVEKILSLPPAFKPGGVINAGNSSPLNTGAAAVLLMSRERMEKYGLKPLAKIKGYAYAGVDPSVMGKGPVPATRKLLSKYNLKVKDIDYWEINEAFAVVTLYAVKELKIDPNKVNIKGGAIAIGHPLGMTGARLIGTLARILKIHNGNLGVATLCVGGGQGVATLIENVD